MIIVFLKQQDNVKPFKKNYQMISLGKLTKQFLRLNKDSRNQEWVACFSFTELYEEISYVYVCV